MKTLMPMTFSCLCSVTRKQEVQPYFILAWKMCRRMHLCPKVQQEAVFSSRTQSAILTLR